MKSPDLEFKKWQGKELSYNNLVDLESAFDVVDEFEKPAACVIKHNTPCGIAESLNLTEALSGAIECDPEASFGGIIGFNRPCGEETACCLYEKLKFVEIVAAPRFSEAALKVLSARKNVRVIEWKLNRHSPYVYRWMRLGFLLQDRDPSFRGRERQVKKNLRCVTEIKPAAEDYEGLLFAWKSVKHVKSNAIVLVKDHRTVGIGAGQMSRVDAVKIACEKAGDRVQGAFLASDGFFPMTDSIEMAHRSGI
jgi:phosphoribosylaminoimidazolecarboxamide formyltransferase/IMP cyclohydrolase